MSWNITNIYSSNPNFCLKMDINIIDLYNWIDFVDMIKNNNILVSKKIVN